MPQTACGSNFAHQSTRSSALKLGKRFVEEGIKIFGTDFAMIDFAEDRGEFSKFLKKLDIPFPEYGTAHEVEEAVKDKEETISDLIDRKLTKALKDVSSDLVTKIVKVLEKKGDNKMRRQTKENEKPASNYQSNHQPSKPAYRKQQYQAWYYRYSKRPNRRYNKQYDYPRSQKRYQQQYRRYTGQERSENWTAAPRYWIAPPSTPPRPGKWERPGPRRNLLAGSRPGS